MNFFAIFFHNFLAWFEHERNSFSFSAYLIPFWQKIMLERGFLVFWIFLLFFSEFSCPGRAWTEFGTNFFLPFLSLYHPVLAKKMLERGFLVFWIFPLLFSEFSCAGQVWTEFGTKIFFLSFLAYLIPFSVKIMPESGFLIFWFFFLFFSEFSCQCQVWTEFGTKSFSSLSRPISSRFG